MTRDDVSLACAFSCLRRGRVRAGLRQIDWAGFETPLTYGTAAVLRIYSGLLVCAETAAVLRIYGALWSKPENMKFILRSGHVPKNSRGVH
jgi:hypothetical protein